MKSISLAAATMLASSLLLVSAGCGDDDDDPTPAPSPRPTATVVPAAGDLPIPDPQELYVANAHGTAQVFQSSGSIDYSWGPSGQLAVVVTTWSWPQTSDLWVVLPDGTRDRIAHFDGYISGKHLWSPDGSRVLLMVDDTSKIRIVSVEVPGGEVKELSDEGRGSPSLIAWVSPEEALIARQGEKGGSLLRMNVRTGEADPVTSLDVQANQYLSESVVSADGMRLLTGAADPAGACGTTGMGNGVYIVELRTGEATKVAEAGSCSVASVAWSPDETAIAYSIFPQGPEPGAFVVDLRSGDQWRISSALDGHLRWLDDATLIVERYPCYWCDGGPTSLVLLPVNGGQERVAVEHSAHSLSASGDRLALADADGVTVAALDGTVIQSVTGPEAGWTYLGMEWAPDDVQFAYSRFHDQRMRLFETDADGGNFQQIAMSKVGEQLSPDGSRVAIIRPGAPENEKDSTLWLADADGSNEQHVDVIYVGSVAWSPDGGKLMLTAESRMPTGEPGTGLFTVNADGSGLTNLDFDMAGKDRVTWSPDGRRLAIWGGALLWFVDVAGDAQDVEVAIPGEIFETAWSGDSSTLAVARVFWGQPERNLILVGSDGTNMRSVAHAGKNIFSIGLSQDASQIAYWANPDSGNNPVLYLMDVTTGVSREIAITVQSGSPTISWSPDGTRFATQMMLAQEGGIYAIDADDLETRQVTDGLTGQTDAWWVSPTRLRFTSEIFGL